MLLKSLARKGSTKLAWTVSAAATLGLVGPRAASRPFTARTHSGSASSNLQQCLLRECGALLEQQPAVVCPLSVLCP